jgi:hypothetical protein
VYSQQIDLNKPKDMFTKDKWLAMSGGFSASSIFYTGNETYQRDPFTYYLNGNINFNIAGLVNLPFTFNFTNSGANYTYPTMPNRLSIHPTYKFLTAHIGDIAMSFSPYTLSGHQFTGAGLDINPNKPFKCSIMYGRLQKAVEFGEGTNEIQAAYKRMGAGVNLRYEKKRYRLAVSLLSVKDNENSLAWKPDSLYIFPQQNVAGSFTGGFELAKNLNLTVDYGISRLNRDLREKDEANKVETFHAYKALLNYTFLSNTVGIGYERVDPGYTTLGAYYFNNDLENITVNYARPFFNNKANIALSAGLQHDNLNGHNDSQTNRFVFSTNANYAASDRLNFSGSYTTFQTHMNLRSQFDYINELTPYDNLDTLNYTQLSQNVNFNALYVFGNSEVRKQQLNLFLSYQEAADKQGNIIPEGSASLFYNASVGYGLQFVPQEVNLNLNLNLTDNRLNSQDIYVWGPTLGVTARFFNKKLTSGIAGSYNTGYLAGAKQNEVWNFRFNAAYLLMKKHSLSLSAIYRNSALLQNGTMAKNNGFTVTAAYSYRF